MKKYVDVCIIIGLIIGLCFLFVTMFRSEEDDVENQNIERQRIYERGYLQACKDMKENKLKFKFVEKTSVTTEWVKIDNLNSWHDGKYVK